MDFLHTESSESGCSQMSHEDSRSGGTPPHGCLVILHLLAEPGCGAIIQRVVEAVLQAVLPLPQALIRVSEHESHQQAPPTSPCPFTQPALAIVLFLREEDEDQRENRALRRLQDRLSRPPWRYHHTVHLAPRRGHIRPYNPSGQDFYSLGGAGDQPLWAVRQVHYGREVVRYTLYCQHASFPLAARLYAAVLGRGPSLSQDGFICFPLFCPHPRCEVQLALKRLLPDAHPTPLPSAILEFRVPDLWSLRPHLPHPCTPVSALRWQTQDYDGHNILLQVSECWSGRASLYPSPCPSSLDSIKHACFHDQEPPSIPSWSCTCQEERARRSLCDRSSLPEALSGASFTTSSSFSSGSLGSPSSSSSSPHLEKHFPQLTPIPYKATPHSGFLSQGHCEESNPRIPQCDSAFRRVLPSATRFQPIREQGKALPCLPAHHSDEFYI